MTKLIIRCSALIAAIALLSCAEAADPFDEAKGAVLQELRDPDSAQFRKLKVVGELTCGEVNARNSFGGYVGYRPFLVWKGAARIAPSGEEIEERLEQVRITGACIDGDTSTLELPTYH